MNPFVTTHMISLTITWHKQILQLINVGHNSHASILTASIGVLALLGVLFGGAVHLKIFHRPQSQDVH